MNQPAPSPRPRFGELAIRAGWLGQQHVDWALRVQADRKQAGVHLYVGSILVQQRYITIEQALQILRHQRVQIMVDPTTTHRYNVHNYNAATTYKSPESPGTLQALQSIDSLVVRGDIGLRQVQQGGSAPTAHGAPGANPAGTARWGNESGAAQGNWEEDWGGGGDGGAAQAMPIAAGQGTADGPVYAELTSDEKKSADEDYDWYGQTILDDGSLAQQLRQAAASHGAGAAAAAAAPAATTAPRSSIKAKPGTVAFLAMPFKDDFQKVYRAMTDLCAAKGIGTVRMDDVADTTQIWKGIERFIAGSHLMIADLSAGQQGAAHVVYEAQHSVRSRKPTVVVTSNPAAKQQCAQMGITLVGDYPAGDVNKLRDVLENLIDQALRQANLVA